MKTLLAGLLAVSLAACQPSEPPAQDATQPVAGSDAASAEQPGTVEATAAAHAGDSPTPSPVAAEAPARPVLEQRLAYGEQGDRNLEGFVAMPADAAEPLPGVLVIHEWWGLNDNIRAIARRLAGEGYIALAVDLYGGAVAVNPEEAQALMSAALSDEERLRDNLGQAYAYLDRYAFSPRIGSIGWCFGGAWSLQTALMLPSEIDAMVMYYGGVVTDPERLEPVEAPMLGLFAERDEVVPVADVQQFRRVLGQLGKDGYVHIYSDVGHAFANPSGGNYAAEEAADAWQRTLDFLEAHLAGGAAGAGD